MRDKQAKFGRALRVSIVACAALTTAIGVIREVGISRAFGQGRPGSSVGRRVRQPLKTALLADYLKRTDWQQVRQQRLRNSANAKNARGRRQFPLTEVNLTPNTPFSDETDTAWSPSGPGSSGTLIALASNRSTPPPANDAKYHLYRMNRDGTSVLQLTRDADFNPPLSGQREPAWNPQAPNKIIYVAPDPYKPPPNPPYNLNGAVTQTDLFIVDTAVPIAPGSNPVRVPLPVGGIKRNPRFLADGITIVFSSNTDITALNDANTPLPGGFNLFTCNAATGLGRTRLTGVFPGSLDNAIANDTFCAPSADATTPMVLFTSDRNGAGAGPRHIWGVRLTRNHTAAAVPFQITGTPVLTTNSGAPSEEFQPDWHDPLPVTGANVFFFASTRNDGNGCLTTHSSIWSLDTGTAQSNTETGAAVRPSIVSIQPPMPPAGVAPYDPNVARCADNLRPSASHAINLVGGTDNVAFASNRQGGSFDIWRTNVVDITPPILTPVAIAGSSFPVMAPGVPSDAPGTLVSGGSSTPRTPRGGLTNTITIACLMTEKESGLQQVRALFHDLDYDKRSTANFDGCCTTLANIPGQLPFCPAFAEQYGLFVEEFQKYDEAHLFAATERQAPRIGTPVALQFFDDGPPSAGGRELQPNAVAGDGVYFCVAQNVSLSAQGLPQGREYSIDIEATDNAGNAFTYDSIWGFSTKTFTPASKLLLVNDHMQGQKFLFQLQDAFPNEVFAAMPCESYWTENPGGREPVTNANSATQARTVAVNSITGLTTELEQNFGISLNCDRTFDHWRILARGPITPDVLNAYVPTREAQLDPNDPSPLATRLAISVPVAEKCVFWGSPYAGNLIIGPGTIEDPGTQQTIVGFLSQGGRILFSGRDIGFALTQNGTQSNSFYTSTLHATFVRDSNKPVGSGVMQPNEKQVNSGADRNFLDGPWGGPGGCPLRVGHYSNEIFPGCLHETTNSLRFPLFSFVGHRCSTGTPVETCGDAWRGDIMNLFRSSEVGGILIVNDEDLFMDMIQPVGGAVTTFTYANNGQPAGLYFRDTSNSSIVGYLAFGVEMVHREYTSSNVPNPAVFRSLNMRAKLIHNIACFFRTGFAFGRVTDLTGNPLPPNANVRLEIITNLTNPPQVVNVSRLAADNSGRWEIHGMPPTADLNLLVRVVSEDSNFFEHPPLNLGWMHGGFGAVKNGQLNFKLRPAPPGSITGRIVDQLNNPVAGLRVFAEMIPPSGSGLLIRRGVSEITNAQGIYSVPGLPQGPAGTKYRLFYNLFTRNRLNPGAGDDVTGFISPVKILGEVVRDDNNAPSVTNDNPPPATVPQLIPQGPAITVTSGQATAVGDTILQQAPGDIAGIVRNQATGLPVTTSPVRITLTVGTPPSFAPPTVPIPGITQSLTDGYYEYCGIPANAGSQMYRVTGLGLGFNRATLDVAVASGLIMCRPGGAFSDTINMTPLANPGTVTGQVRRLDDNAGILNAAVTLSFLGVGETGAGTLLATTTSNAQGNYTFNGVFATAAGERFVVQSVKPNFTTATSSEFTMGAGQTQTVNLPMDPPGSVSGVIRIASNNVPVANATVTALEANGNPLLNPDTPGLPFTTTSTAAVTADVRSNNLQFNYRLRDLPPQSIQLRVSASGFSDQVRANLNIPVHGEIAGQDILMLPLKIYTQGLQMMSHPFITGGEPVTTTLGITVGPGAGNAARLARFNTVSNAYEEFGTSTVPANQGFELGRGYFFLLNQSTLNITREGASQPTGAPFAIPTFNGWNMIGYPFAPRGDFANGIDWQTTIVRTLNGGDQSITAAAANGLVRSGLFTYTGNGYSLVGRITPFGGYWARVLQNNVTLVINNVPLRSSRVRNQAKLNAFQSLVEHTGAEGWAFGLVAQTAKARDESTLLGASTTARDDYDLHKSETPPPVQMAPFVSVTFPHPEWGSNAGRYAVDIRSPVIGEKSWNFEVTSNEPNESVALSWPKLTSNLPRQYRVFLTDLDGNQRRYLRTVSSYSFTNQANQPRHFRLTITSSNEQRLEVQSVLASPTGTGRVAFSFVLSREADLRVTVLNPAGKPIELSSSRGRAGLNSVMWGGTDQRGNRVPRGVYTLRILATDPETGQEVQKVKPVTLK